MPPSKSWLRQPPPSDEERARREAIRARGYREQTFPERIRTAFPARAGNDIEGNYTGINHVLHKFPQATSFHRFVVSEAYSKTIREHELTRTWVNPQRGIEYKKYPYPISFAHLTETVIYPIYQNNYADLLTEVCIESLTVIPPNVVQMQFE